MKTFTKLLIIIVINGLTAGYGFAQEYSLFNRSFEENMIFVSSASDKIITGSIGRSVTGTVESNGILLRANSFGYYKQNTITSAGTKEGSVKPSKYSLSQNYPNPFNPSTKIAYSVPSENNVNITIYNTLGERIQVLVDEIKSAGNYEIIWNADPFANGVYFCIMTSGEFRDSKKLILLK